VITDVPELTPLTIPLPDPMVATDVLLLLHVPPDVVLVNDIVLPAQTLPAPEIEPGEGITVIAVKAIQPVPNE
jgi:hypothetical protein